MTQYLRRESNMIRTFENHEQACNYYRKAVKSQKEKVLQEERKLGELQALLEHNERLHKVEMESNSLEE